MTIIDTRSGTYDRVSIINDENGKYINPYLVHRAKFIRAEDRDDTEHKGISHYFNLDYMGSTEFECGTIWNRMLEMENSIDSFDVEFTITHAIRKDSKLRVWAFYYPGCYDRQGAEHALRMVWENKRRFKEWTDFNEDAIARAMQTDDRYRKDTWFEIQGGLFWTTNRVAARIMIKAIQKSAWIVRNAKKAREDLAREAKQRAEAAALHAQRGSPGSLRERLIAEGKLRPWGEN